MTDGNYHFLGDISTFENLKSLETQNTLLFQHRDIHEGSLANLANLPNSIESLRLHTMLPEQVDLIPGLVRGYIRLKAECLSNLEYLTFISFPRFCFPYRKNWSTSESMTVGLIKECAAVGIELVMETSQEHESMDSTSEHSIGSSERYDSDD